MMMTTGCRAATVSLIQPWQQIERRLLSMLDDEYIGTLSASA
jgi:hypothetical protein